MPSPEQDYIKLTEQDNVQPEVAAAIFAALQPATAELLTRGDGVWDGGAIKTGHPGEVQLRDMQWVGKTFRSSTDVDPIVVYDEAGGRKVKEAWGHAELRELTYAKRNTIAMVYNSFPATDYFHYVNDDLVAGVMETAMDGLQEPFYFFLKRHNPTMGTSTGKTVRLQHPPQHQWSEAWDNWDLTATRPARLPSITWDKSSP
ncbi:GXWXG protein domain-containing protein [Ophiocordyceps camponoti-floridani]|uniref:GXWXG protein domain-containing protein n=1 Tax=Ophiocordyceps camponoti-floridani TaxID=2030778 RepID=A0A8H4VAK7_9HYPO|nr:GXWXG protein domain-containing protein [Ophiocordyceps camponoti-floridani]